MSEVICSTILRGNFLHLKTVSYCASSDNGQFLPFSSLLEADTIFYRAINKSWHSPPPSLQSPCGTSLGCDVNVISFHMALQRANVTAESCSAFSLLSLPTFLSAACLSALVWMGGLVKCIIYPCLPPWSGNHTKRGPSPWIQHLPCQHCL